MEKAEKEKDLRRRRMMNMVGCAKYLCTRLDVFNGLMISRSSFVSIAHRASFMPIVHHLSSTYHGTPSQPSPIANHRVLRSHYRSNVNIETLYRPQEKCDVTCTQNSVAHRTACYDPHAKLDLLLTYPLSQTTYHILDHVVLRITHHSSSPVLIVFGGM